MENEQENTDPWYLNKLKKVSTQTLENTVAKALGELTGVDYECWIQQLDYEKPSGGLQSCSFTVSLSEKKE
jgi:ABC-type cobalt transport system substrate-binding protein